MNELAQTIHKNNVKKGFYDTPPTFGEQIALIHSELSEALESHRQAVTVDHKSMASKVLNIADDEDYKEAFLLEIKDTVEDEIADSLIRLLDVCGQRGIDIDSHIAAKLRYNQTRPYKHGKKY